MILCVVQKAILCVVPEKDMKKDPAKTKNHFSVWVHPRKYAKKFNEKMDKIEAARAAKILGLNPRPCGFLRTLTNEYSRQVESSGYRMI